MKLKLKTIWGAREALARMSARELPYKTARPLAKLASAVQGELEILEAQRVKLYKKHGGSGDQLEGAALEAFLAEFTALLSEEIEADAQPALLTDELLETMTLPAADINALDGLVLFGQEAADVAG